MKTKQWVRGRSICRVHVNSICAVVAWTFYIHRVDPRQRDPFAHDSSIQPVVGCTQRETEGHLPRGQHAPQCQLVVSNFCVQFWDFSANSPKSWRYWRWFGLATRLSRYDEVCLHVVKMFTDFLSVAHKVYGIPQTINTANYVYFIAYRELSLLRSTPHRYGYDSESLHDAFKEPMHKTQPPQKRRIFTERDLEMIMTGGRNSWFGLANAKWLVQMNLSTCTEGKALICYGGIPCDVRQKMNMLQWLTTVSPPTCTWCVILKLAFRDRRIVQDRCETSNGLLYKKLWRVCAVYCTNHHHPYNKLRDYIPLVNLVGVYFQIRDDYMNLQSDEYSSHKGFAEDLTEGKFSFPVVHGIHADKSNRRIISEHNINHILKTLTDHTLRCASTTTDRSKPKESRDLLSQRPH